VGGRNTRTRVSEPIHGLNGFIKSIQRGIITVPSGGAGTFTTAITSVNMAKAWCEGGKGNMNDLSTSRAHSEPWLDTATTAKLDSDSGSAGSGDSVAFEVRELYG